MLQTEVQVDGLEFNQHRRLRENDASLVELDLVGHAIGDRDHTAVKSTLATTTMIMTKTRSTLRGTRGRSKSKTIQTKKKAKTLGHCPTKL